MSMSIRNAAICQLVAATMLAACSKPEPPPRDQPPEPQAQHTELRDAIQQPIDQAKAVEKSVQDAADRQQAEIDVETGG